MDLGGGFASIWGKIGLEIPPKVERLADKALLYLDIVQHYYCTEAEEARKQAQKTKDEDKRGMFETRQSKMLEERDKVFNTLKELAIKGGESVENLIGFFTERRNELLRERGIGETDIIKNLTELEKVYSEASPFLSTKKEIEISENITTHGSILGKIENRGNMAYIHNLNLFVGGEVRPIAPEETQKLIKEILKLLDKSIGGNKT